MWVIFVAVVLGFASAPFVFLGLFLLLAYTDFRDNRDHPDHAHFAARFADVRQVLDSDKTRAVIDFAPLNGGAWRTACLFGGYTSPVERMEALGATITPADRDRLTRPHGLRLGQVEEFEMLVAFMDEQDRAHFIYFRDGLGSAGQHYQKCVTKPETQVAIGN